jgi:hypothetical protein
MPKLATLARLTLFLLLFQLSWEILIRIYLFGFTSMNPVLMDSIRGFGTSGLIRASPHREILYELEPNLDTYYKKVPFRTNSVGLRDKEYSLAKPPGTFRVAVVGDSFTLPSGVAIEDAFHSILEERLSGGPSGTRYEFINFAAGGYGLRQYLAVLEHKALAYEPDLLVVGFCPFNDFIPFPDEVFDTAYQSKPVERSPFLRLHSWPESLRMLRRIGVQKIDLPGQRVSPEQRVNLYRNLARLADLGRRAGAPVVVINLSVLPSPGDTIQVLDRAVRSAGLHVLHVESLFDPERKFEHMIYRADGHPNDKAHGVFADALYDFLRDRELVNP